MSPLTISTSGVEPDLLTRRSGERRARALALVGDAGGAADAPAGASGAAGLVRGNPNLLEP